MSFLSALVQCVMNMASISSCFLVVFLLSSSLNYVNLAEENCSIYQTHYYIVNKASGKVLADGDRSGNVALYEFDGSFDESYFNNFRFYPSPRIGLFTIHIKSYMGALKVNLEDNTLYMIEDMDSIYQQWFFNADGTIVNGGLYNHGLKVNRTSFGQSDAVYLAPMDTFGSDDIWEIIASPWQITH